MVRSLLILIAATIPQAHSTICWQCGGEEYGSGLRVLHSGCCRPQRRVCAQGLACLRATVNSPGMQFILSGCHPPEDGFIGCDSHRLPFNATIQRCACLDEACQQYFPGDCASTEGTEGAESAQSRPLIAPPVPSNVFTNLINNVGDSMEKNEKSVEYGDDEEAFRSIREREELVKILKNNDKDSTEEIADPLIDPKTSIFSKKHKNSGSMCSSLRDFSLILLIFRFIL